MAGSGCSATFKVLRTLQKRKDAGYGSHMATGMAIGMLFLGSGRRTLMTSPHAVASLYISLYPRFPTVATDNTYHPQFLRPLYVLATVPRILETRDVDTGDSCAVPVRINGAKEVTPCVFPPNNSLETLEVEAGCDYYRLSLTRAIPRHQSMLVGGVVWVKKKPSPANDGIYKALHGEGPLNVASIIGTEPDRVHHAVASVTQQLVKGLDTTLQGLWDVKTAVAAVEHPPTRVLETAEVLSKIFPSSCRLTLDAHYEGALRTAVRKFSSPDVALTPAELRALAWFSIPADRGILEKASRSRSEFIAAFPLVSPAVFTLFDGE
ncbi:Anaphase-promoting complex subunit 1 [Diplonema papillatum]|nr:Anaphase-promoting complex subunit 1 [Diplonema papillatum]